MAKFFDIPTKDKIKGHHEALDLIENFLKNPQDKADTFSLDEPTAVFQKAADTDQNSHTEINNAPEKSELRSLALKLVITLSAILFSLVIAWLVVNYL